MKHYYFQAGIYRSMKMLGMILSAVILITACSNDFEESSVKLDSEETKAIVEKGDSILRFLTIEELEDISISDIPGNNSGYELAELTYECTDTIELRALRLDVKATLTSANKTDKIISFTAEVGPELVSVEYYPSVEVVPAHDNMIHSVYPMVARYRNYSDGTRIGPDEFYDYGHMLHITYIPPEYQIDGANRWVPYYINENHCFIPFSLGVNVNPDVTYYKDGIFYTYCNKGIMEYNLNTTVIADNGAIYSGEDFFHTNVKFREDWSTIYEHTADVGNFYTMYRPSALYDVSNEETAYYLNLCSNVPDVSPTPYTEDTKSLSPGWYYGEFNDRSQSRDWLYSNFELSDNFMDGLYGRKFSTFVEVYLQYLVIDNRIIDFVDIALKDYKKLDVNYPTFTITKISSGYMVHSEFEEILYGEKFKSVYDLELKGVYGPDNIWDLSNYQSTQWKDEEEIKNIATRSGMEAPDMKALIPREDGKAIIIDRHLPKTINNHKTRSSIKRK